MRRALAALCCVLSVAGCGDDSGPTGPTSASVGGVWRLTTRLTQVDGGECIGALFQNEIGAQGSYTLAITQTGATVDAVSTSTDTGAVCRFLGSVGQSTMTLNGVSCEPAGFRIQCANGTIRDVVLQTDAITATIRNTSATGTEAETYSIRTTAGVGVSILTLNSTITATRQ